MLTLMHTHPHTHIHTHTHTHTPTHTPTHTDELEKIETNTLIYLRDLSTATPDPLCIFSCLSPFVYNSHLLPHLSVSGVGLLLIPATLPGDTPLPWHHIPTVSLENTPTHIHTHTHTHTHTHLRTDT